MMTIPPNHIMLSFSLVARLRLARISNHLLELRHGQDAGDAEFADNEGGRPPKAEALGLLAVALENAVNRFGVCVEVALGAVDIDASPGQQLVDARFRQ